MEFKGLRVGSLVEATVQTGVCERGERGVVYEVYALGKLAGVSIIFAHGGYDGFSATEIDRMLKPLGVVDPGAATYRFLNVFTLVRDFERGVFNGALYTEAKV